MTFRRCAGVLAALPLLQLLFLGGAARATQVKIFQTQSQAGFLAGKLQGVSVDALGRMQLAPRAERVASLGEPFLLSAAVHPDGWVVGTGNAGKLLKIDRKGVVTELFTAPEPEIFAVWVDPDGTIFAGTSPHGKVYRIPPAGGPSRGPAGKESKGKGKKKAKDGKDDPAPAKAEIYFDPGETYIWTMARAADGSLLVGTGTQGKLFRVRAAGKDAGKGEVLYDSDDTHIRTLAVLPGGDVLLGTSGEGLILRLGANGEVRTLYDATQPEVVSLTVGPDGTCYAAVISSEASLTDVPKDAAIPGGAKSGEATVTVTMGDEPPPAAAGGGGRAKPSGPRSTVLSISPAGVVETLWSFPEETVYGLLWRPDGLWVATGLEGKLYRWSDSQMLLEKDVDERQIVALLPGESGPAFATTNAAAFYRVTAGRETKGTYTSAALDAGQASRFGTFRWRGEAPGPDSLRFSFRSGVSAEPDRTWSAWTEAQDGGDGKEVSLAGLPRGRYVQWRAEMHAAVTADAADGKSPLLYGAELSYRQENLKPKIDILGSLEPGQILVPANFNPSNQVYEPSHPNREGIFTTPGAPADDEGGRTKVLWKKGYRTLRWIASDPNEDELVYDLSFRPADAPASPAGSSTGWMKVAAELKEPYYSFDATVLPDGVYRFRLRASDRLANLPESALTVERVSDPVVNDHTPPVLDEVKQDGDRLRVTVHDALSPLREAVYSLDASEWKPAEPADGLLDGRKETLLILFEKAGEKKGGLILLRVTDAAYNVTTFNLSQER
jgi:hypothetical protein